MELVLWALSEETPAQLSQQQHLGDAKPTVPANTCLDDREDQGNDNRDMLSSNMFWQSGFLLHCDDLIQCRATTPRKQVSTEQIHSRSPAPITNEEHKEMDTKCRAPKLV